MTFISGLIDQYQEFNVALRRLQLPFLTYTHCKFHPSCSEYAQLAVTKYGPLRGSLKALGRIIRCNPFSKGGVDLP